MKQWFARFVLVAGLYDLFLAMIFLFASPLVSVFLQYPLSILSGALLQIMGVFLLALGFALSIASRNLEHYLIIPIANTPA
ncbi:MAG: hypothetical protein ACFFCF_10530 [Promethearchaeota archaeon]